MFFLSQLQSIQFVLISKHMSSSFYLHPTINMNKKLLKGNRKLTSWLLIINSDFATRTVRDRLSEINSKYDGGGDGGGLGTILICSFATSTSNSCSTSPSTSFCVRKKKMRNTIIKGFIQISYFVHRLLTSVSTSKASKRAWTSFSFSSFSLGVNRFRGVSDTVEILVSTGSLFPIFPVNQKQIRNSVKIYYCNCYSNRNRFCFIFKIMTYVLTEVRVHLTWRNVGNHTWDTNLTFHPIHFILLFSSKGE